MKFIQAGDFHLDTYYGSEKLKRFGSLEDLETFGKICQVAINNKADFLFLTGDIFDNDGIRNETFEYIVTSLNKLSDTKVYISPGNHDYIGRNSVYLSDRWPSNVHIFKDFETVFDEDKKVYISGAGFKSQNSLESLIPEDLVLDTQYPNILVIHGITEPGAYNPMRIEDLKKFDYCAIGHVHRNHGIKDPNLNYAYSGSPIARNFNEVGDHGYILGYMDKFNVTTNFVPLDGRKFINLEVDITSLISNEDIKTVVHEEITKAVSKSGFITNDVIRVILIGVTEVDVNLQYLESGLDQNINLYSISDETEYPFDFEAISNEETLAGRFTKKLLSMEDNPLSQKALKRGLKALIGKNTL